MFEDELDDKNRMVFSACRDCEYFRAYCLDDGKKGFCCSEGKDSYYFLSLDFPLMDREQKKAEILRYQKNELPADCRYYTQCSMLSIVEDVSEVDSLISDDYDIVETVACMVDLQDKGFKDIVARDSSFTDWCLQNPTMPVVLLKKDNDIHGCVFMKVEKDEDYSWIIFTDSRKYYFKEGETRLGIFNLWADKEIVNAKRILMSMAYRKAVQENVDELYAVSYADTLNMFLCGDFRRMGYALGGEGKDTDLGATVLAKRRIDLVIDDDSKVER